MSELRLELDAGRASFTPGETLRVLAGWKMSQPADALDLRLFWFTRGAGTPEVTVVQSWRIEHPAMEGSEQFAIAAPAFPFSFHGALFELNWGLELVVMPGKELARQVIVIAPGARPILVADAAQTPPPLPCAA